MSARLVERGPGRITDKFCTPLSLQHNIDSSMSWDKTMKVIVTDPRYGVLKTVGEKKARPLDVPSHPKFVAAPEKAHPTLRALLLLICISKWRRRPSTSTSLRSPKRKRRSGGSGTKCAAPHCNSEAPIESVFCMSCASARTSN